MNFFDILKEITVKIPGYSMQYFAMKVQNCLSKLNRREGRIFGCIVWRLCSMVDMVGNFREPPIMWSIPFTLLLITLLLAAADMLFPFLPLEVGPHSWMWAASTLISAVIASL